MQFMLLVHAAPAGWEGLDEAAAEAGLTARADAIARLRESGRLIACSPLSQPEEGREVRVRNGSTVVSDLTEMEEPIAGFYLVEAENFEEAVAVAASIPDSVSAHMTVRPLMALPGIPGELPRAIGTDHADE
jgi:hypothetical protein